MGKAMHGRFQGTAGSSASSNTLNDNLPKLTKKYPLSKDGYFAPRGSGGNHVRVMKCKDPLGTAKEFYKIATHKSLSKENLDNTIGQKAVLKDGTTITIRPVSSSLDKSPAIDIRRVSPGRVKEQKIHFIKDTKHD
jgi:hypothetical protein